MAYQKERRVITKPLHAQRTKFSEAAGTPYWGPRKPHRLLNQWSSLTCSSNKSKSSTKRPLSIKPTRLRPITYILKMLILKHSSVDSSTVLQQSPLSNTSKQVSIDSQKPGPSYLTPIPSYCVAPFHRTNPSLHARLAVLVPVVS